MVGHVPHVPVEPEGTVEAEAMRAGGENGFVQNLEAGEGEQDDLVPDGHEGFVDAAEVAEADAGKAVRVAVGWEAAAVTEAAAGAGPDPDVEVAEAEPVLED